MDEDTEAQGDLYSAPTPAPAPAPRIEPQIIQSAAPQPAAPPPMTRIVDPSVADEDDEPLFADTAFEDRRPQRSGGFLSLFGSRPRYDAPAPAARPAARGGAQPAEAPAPQEQADSQEDLEIPSFLRRLAN